MASAGLVNTLLTAGGFAANNAKMPQEEGVLIEALERRLAQRYATLPRKQIAVAIQHAYARFDGARVRDFVPLLVERRAEEELTSLSTPHGDESMG